MSVCAPNLPEEMRLDILIGQIYQLARDSSDTGALHPVLDAIRSFYDGLFGVLIHLDVAKTPRLSSTALGRQPTSRTRTPTFNPFSMDGNTGHMPD